jgi:glyoxylase-like metal-dependent hydrolase (beta-lactamase superfamily II)
MEIMAKSDDIQIKRLTLGSFGTNAYIVLCLKTGDSILIDAPANPPAILEALHDTHLRYILLTHSHTDHIGALSALRSEFHIPTGAHSADARDLSPFPEMLLKDGDTLQIGNITIEVLYTPGHTPGSLCFRARRYLISGDTIFPGGPGRTWSPDGFKQIIKSITGKIMMLPEDIKIYPGHGPSTVLKKEKEEFVIFTSRSPNPHLYGQVTWLES